MKIVDERIRLLNGSEVNRNARYVLYWMQMFKRARYNHALDFAIKTANERGLPLVVYEGLKYYYPWANDRIHTFILQGVSEKREEFARRGIRYIFYLQRHGRDPRRTLARLANEAALIVTDDFPCFIIPEQNRRLVEQVNVPVFAVDSNGMIPVSAFEKEEYSARTIRPKIKRMLALPFYGEYPVSPGIEREAGDLDLDCPETRVTGDNLAELVSQCDIDHSVKPSPLYSGGSRIAHERLRHFVERILPRYDELRNEPSVDGTSRLSPYLHFGFISIFEIVAAVKASPAPERAKELFLEEAIVRRELSFNFTRHNPSYDSLDALPAWALKTMEQHKDDERPNRLSERLIERGQTYDELWNASQRELLRTGEMHNYVRMLWGKMVIEWRPSYEQAFRLLVHLNNKYALDGRNPNSYAGILWCFGKHDRAWGPERPIFGKLRYMSSRGMARKFDSRAYIEWTRGLRE
jgi:deoxyribodipyrimidine photo-lyase